MGRNPRYFPYPNEHACRLNDPDKYDRFNRVNCNQKHTGKCIDVIFGITGSGQNTKSEIQALRYPITNWTADVARSHCADRKGRFEPAIKPKK